MLPAIDREQRDAPRIIKQQNDLIVIATAAKRNSSLVTGDLVDMLNLRDAYFPGLHVESLERLRK